VFAELGVEGGVVVAQVAFGALGGKRVFTQADERAGVDSRVVGEIREVGGVLLFDAVVVDAGGGPFFVFELLRKVFLADVVVLVVLEVV